MSSARRTVPIGGAYRGTPRRSTNPLTWRRAAWEVAGLVAFLALVLYLSQNWHEVLAWVPVWLVFRLSWLAWLYARQRGSGRA